MTIELANRLPSPMFASRRPRWVAMVLAIVVATSLTAQATGYTASVDAMPVEDPFAVFDMFVTIDARTLPKTVAGARDAYEDTAGTR